jgi:hypothetical protein
MSEKDWCVVGAVVRHISGCFVFIEKITTDNGVYTAGGRYYCRTDLTPLNNGLNGYRYGIEYLTNGKKPDLPDNVKIRWTDSQDSAETRVYMLNWNGILSFKIIDTEYKPHDESVTKESLTDDWYDYDNHKMLRNPKEGCVCEVLYQEDWLVAEVVKSKHPLSGSFAVFYEKQLADGRNLFWSGEARPLDWNRKAEAERKLRNRTINGAIDVFASALGDAEGIAKLYDLGFLRMPEDK